MSRPFIEFLQVQSLAWQPGADAVGAARPGAEVRVLSLDERSGASSLLLRYPPGWRQDDPVALVADEELFVLAGDLRIGDTVHTRYSYAHLPAGLPRTGLASSGGAVVLTFFSAHPGAAGRGTGEATVGTRHIQRIDALEGEWGGNFHPQFPPGAGRKWLRRDPVTTDETWVLGTMPLRSGRRAEKHPVVEEMYLLAGELVGHVGTMRAGAYFWRPPEEWHGPFGSLTGNLMLFRTVGGPLSTTYRDDEQEFSWTPQHRPILPPDLAVQDDPSRACGCPAY